MGIICRCLCNVGRSRITVTGICIGVHIWRELQSGKLIGFLHTFYETIMIFISWMCSSCHTIILVLSMQISFFMNSIVPA